MELNVQSGSIVSRLLSRTACIQRDGEANAAAPRALQFADAPVPAQAPPATPAMAASSALMYLGRSKRSHDETEGEEGEEGEKGRLFGKRVHKELPDGIVQHYNGITIRLYLVE